jgi:sugar lactone lactonase YvrE
MKWVKGQKEGIVVAGGRGQGNDVTQLSDPLGVIVDQSRTVYVSDAGNARIIRWHEGSTRGEVILGGNDEGQQPNQLNRPNGLAVDQDGNLYVVEENNH